MKKAVILFVLCILLTACSAAEKDDPAAENAGEPTAAATTEASFMNLLKQRRLQRSASLSSGSEDFIKISDNIIKTYHLHN